MSLLVKGLMTESFSLKVFFKILFLVIEEQEISVTSFTFLDVEFSDILYNYSQDDCNKGRQIFL